MIVSVWCWCIFVNRDEAALQTPALERLLTGSTTLCTTEKRHTHQKERKKKKQEKKGRGWGKRRLVLFHSPLIPKHSKQPQLGREMQPG